jgi:superfamily II DNA or RNA helicase
MVANPNLLPLFDDKLRPYQSEAITDIRKAFRQGNDAVMFCLPTGCGKTRTAVCLPRDGARIMVVCAQDELVKQWVQSIRELRRRAASIEQTRNNWADAGDCWIVATFQTLGSNNGDEPRFRRLLGQIDLIIWDECDTHFSKASRDMLNEFIAAGARVLGITATPFRTGKKDSLFGFFETCAYSMDLRDAFDQGWLVKPRIRTHRVKSIRLDHLKASRLADFDPVQLERELMREAPLHDIASLIAQNHDRSNGHAMVRCVRKTQARALTQILWDRHGIKTACVLGSQPDSERQEQLEMFKSGEATVICNVRVLGRGVDIPFINEVYNAAPTKSKAILLQAMGRATRTVDDCLAGCDTVEERLAAIAGSSKPSWIFHDLTATTEYHTLTTPIELLVRDTELVDRIKEKHADDDEVEVTLDDLDEEELEEDRRIKELARLEKEMRRQRMQGLNIRVEYESRDRDLYEQALAKTPKVQCWRFLFGQHRGRPLRDPAATVNYLRWYYSKMTRLDHQTAVANEIARREKQMQEVVS